MNEQRHDTTNTDVDPLERMLEPLHPDDMCIDLGDTIPSVPGNAGDMLKQLTAAIHDHLSKDYSPPRVTPVAPKPGLTQGSAFDITINNENGQPWNFDFPEQRERDMQQRNISETL